MVLGAGAAPAFLTPGGGGNFGFGGGKFGAVEAAPLAEEMSCGGEDGGRGAGGTKGAVVSSGSGDDSGADAVSVASDRGFRAILGLAGATRGAGGGGVTGTERETGEGTAGATGAGTITSAAVLGAGETLGFGRSTGCRAAPSPTGDTGWDAIDADGLAAGGVEELVSPVSLGLSRNLGAFSSLMERGLAVSGRGENKKMLLA